MIAQSIITTTRHLYINSVKNVGSKKKPDFGCLNSIIVYIQGVPKKNRLWTLFGHLSTILDTLHRFVRFWTPWPFLDAFGSLKASKKCPKCYKASKSIRTVQIVQEGPNLCNVSKIVKKCPKYQKGSKVKKVYCCFFFGTQAFSSTHPLLSEMAPPKI